jgi:hypothetical protein
MTACHRGVVHAALAHPCATALPCAIALPCSEPDLWPGAAHRCLPARLIRSASAICKAYGTITFHQLVIEPNECWSSEAVSAGKLLRRVEGTRTGERMTNTCARFAGEALDVPTGELLRSETVTCDCKLVGPSTPARAPRSSATIA